MMRGCHIAVIFGFSIPGCEAANREPTAGDRCPFEDIEHRSVSDSEALGFSGDEVATIIEGRWVVDAIAGDSRIVPDAGRYALEVRLEIDDEVAIGVGTGGEECPYNDGQVMRLTGRIEVETDPDWFSAGAQPVEVWARSTALEDVWILGTLDSTASPELQTAAESVADHWCDEPVVDFIDFNPDPWHETSPDVELRRGGLRVSVCSSITTPLYWFEVVP